MTIQNFTEAHRVLQKYVPPTRSLRENYTLDRMKLLMEGLGNPQENYQIIHVAGTSGKTSTSYYIAALLTQTGRKVGLSVSPHIEEVNERVQVNMRPLAEAEFCDMLGEFINLVENLGVHPTYFELLTAFAFWYYDKIQVDYAVMEVGMGGLLDGTNVINNPSKICAIADIGLDHTKVLGDTIPEIAYQKAGIIQPGNSVFMNRQSSEIVAVIERQCTRQGAALQVLEAVPSESVAKDLPLFQQRNWQLACSVIQSIKQKDELPDISDAGLRKAVGILVPGRMEILQYGDKIIILDGAHNEQKMHAFVESILEKYPDQKRAVLLGIVSDKSAKSKPILDEVSKMSSTIIVTSFKTQQDIERISIDPHTLLDGEYSSDLNLLIIEEPEAASVALLQRPESILIITGSFYLLNKLRPQLVIAARA